MSSLHHTCRHDELRKWFLFCCWFALGLICYFTFYFGFGYKIAFQYLQVMMESKAPGTPTLADEFREKQKQRALSIKIKQEENLKRIWLHIQGRIKGATPTEMDNDLIQISSSEIAPISRKDDPLIPQVQDLCKSEGFVFELDMRHICDAQSGCHCEDVLGAHLVL